MPAFVHAKVPEAVSAVPRSGLSMPAFRALECSEEGSGGEEAERQRARCDWKRDVDSLERVIVARQVRRNRIHRRSVTVSGRLGRGAWTYLRVLDLSSRRAGSRGREWPSAHCRSGIAAALARVRGLSSPLLPSGVVNR
jgi:hypothetical protein